MMMVMMLLLMMMLVLLMLRLLMRLMLVLQLQLLLLTLQLRRDLALLAGERLYRIRLLLRVVREKRLFLRNICFFFRDKLYPDEEERSKKDVSTFLLFAQQLILNMSFISEFYRVIKMRFKEWTSILEKSLSQRITNGRNIVKKILLFVVKFV